MVQQAHGSSKTGIVPRLAGVDSIIYSRWNLVVKERKKKKKGFES